MDYVTTNVRLLNDDYIRIKQAALRERKSMAAYIRGALALKTESKNTQQLMSETRRVAQQNAKYLTKFDGVQVLQEMRESQ